MMRCSEEYGKQWRPKQGKLEWQKQKEEEKREKKEKLKKEKKKKKSKGSKMMNMKKVAEEWEIWDEKEEVARSEKEIKKLALKQFHKWNTNEEDMRLHNRVEREVYT